MGAAMSMGQPNGGGDGDERGGVLRSHVNAGGDVGVGGGSWIGGSLIDSMRFSNFSQSEFASAAGHGGADGDLEDDDDPEVSAAELAAELADFLKASVGNRGGAGADDQLYMKLAEAWIRYEMRRRLADFLKTSMGVGEDDGVPDQVFMDMAEPWIKHANNNGEDDDPEASTNVGRGGDGDGAADGLGARSGERAGAARAGPGRLIDPIAEAAAWRPGPEVDVDFVEDEGDAIGFSWAGSSSAEC